MSISISSNHFRAVVRHFDGADQNFKINYQSNREGARLSKSNYAYLKAADNNNDGKVGVAELRQMHQSKLN